MICDFDFLINLLRENAGWEFDEEQYFIIDKKIPMFLSDDAHHISQVCKHFADAKAYADSFGVNLVGLNKIL